MDERQDAQTTPGAVAARRARAAGAARGSGAGTAIDRARAYPAVGMVEDHEALTAVLAATRALLRVTAPAHVVEVVRTLVHDLGGGVVPARLADERSAVQIDVSLGLSEPVLAWAEPVSPAAMRLTTVLPGFVEDARLVLADLLDGVRQAASEDVVPLPVVDGAGPTGAGRAQAAAGAWATAMEAYVQAVDEVDPRAARELVLDLLERGAPLDRITTEVLAPAQVRAGLRWEQGEWSVADEHAATAITEAALGALTHAAETGPVRPGAQHVALACAEGEWHALPARMAAARAASRGVRITVLGPSLPAEQLGRRLAAGDVDLLALSCTVPSNLVGAARCIAAAHAQGVPVLAGGRAFGLTGQRAFAVGADAWSDDPAALRAAPPALAGRTSAISAEVLFLDSVDDLVLALAHQRLTSTFPSLLQRRTGPPAGTVEDLRSLARSTGAALLTDDVAIVDELLVWSRRHVGNRVPDAVVATAALLLADGVEPVAPAGAQLLRDAAERLERATSPA